MQTGPGMSLLLPPIEIAFTTPLMAQGLHKDHHTENPCIMSKPETNNLKPRLALFLAHYGYSIRFRPTFFTLDTSDTVLNLHYPLTLQHLYIFARPYRHRIKYPTIPCMQALIDSSAISLL